VSHVLNLDLLQLSLPSHTNSRILLLYIMTSSPKNKYLHNWEIWTREAPLQKLEDGSLWDTAYFEKNKLEEQVTSSIKIAEQISVRKMGKIYGEEV
jgi:hypothetical protein